jgi:hypothetical protein
MRVSTECESDGDEHRQDDYQDGIGQSSAEVGSELPAED